MNGTNIYENLGLVLDSQRAVAKALDYDSVLECSHPSTHTEQHEHDQLPGQDSLWVEDIEVCDVCDEVVEL